MQIQLLISLPESRSPISVEVEDTLTVSTCALLLAQQIGLPVITTTGAAVVYQLFRPDGRGVLPDHQSLGDLQIGSGESLLLDNMKSEGATIPLVEAPIPVVSSPSISRKWTRRPVMSSIFLGCVLGGFVLGGTYAIVSMYSAKRLENGSPSPPVTLRDVMHFSQHTKQVRTVSWSPDGTLLASGGDDAQVVVWTPAGMIKKAIVDQPPIQSIAWSPESQRLIIGAANQVSFFTALTGNRLAVRHHAAQVTSVAWTGKGRMQAASGSADRRVVIWDPDRFEPQTVFGGHTTAVQGISFSSDGQSIGSSSQGGAVRVWATVDGRELHPFYFDTRQPVLTLAFAPSGAILAVGGSDGKIRLWNGLICQTIGRSDQGRICADVPQRLQHSTFAIRTLAWSPDAKYLASGNDAGMLLLWNPTQSQDPIFSTILQPNVPILSITWSPNGKFLATSTGKVVVIWALTARI